MDSRNLSRRELLVAGWFPFFFWRKRKARIGEAKFEIIRHGSDRRRYIWIHGNEQTARQVLRSHMKQAEGRAFLVESTERYVPLNGGKLDPNRMFSRVGAERNLRTVNPNWTPEQMNHALDLLDRDRAKFVKTIMPKDGRLFVALHNNSSGYSVNDEVAISDSVALNNKDNPHEFMLCTMRSDFERLARSPFNVVLQHSAPPDDDGSLSRLAAIQGVRYLNIEAAHGNTADQTKMLAWVEKELP